MQKQEKEIIEKCRKLIIPCNKVLTQAFSTWLKSEHNDCSMNDIVESLQLLRDIEALLGYREDEIQEGTNVKNLKLFYNEDF